MAVRILIILSLLTAGAALPDPLSADTRMGIMPQAEAVQIRLPDKGNPLVQEYHHLSLDKGIHQVAFSWSGMSLDPDTVLFTPLEDPESVQVLSTTIPPDGSSLIWEIECQKTGAVPVVISYLTIGLDSLVTYTATVNARETDLNLDAELALRNFSGQTYPLARVWLDPDTAFATQILDQEIRQFPFSVSGDTQITKRFHWDGQTMPHDPENMDSYAGVPFGYQLGLPEVCPETTGTYGAAKLDFFWKIPGAISYLPGKTSCLSFPEAIRFSLKPGAAGILSSPNGV